MRSSSEGPILRLIYAVENGHIVIGCDVEPAVIAGGLKDRREVNFAAQKGAAARLEKCLPTRARVPGRGRARGLLNRPVSTHGRRPAINALVTAGDGPSITAQSCFSRHLGPGPRI